MDYIRELLLEIEEKSDGTFKQLDIDGKGRTLAEKIEHLFLMHERGLIDARDASSMGNRDIIVLRLTWDGHEFLDAIRDPDIWAKTRNGALAAGGFTLDLLRQLAVGFLKKKISENTGIEL